MKKVTFRGTGQLNGCRIIDLTIDVEDKTALDLHGPKRNEVKSAILAVHYPGVNIKPNQIACTITDIKEPKTTRIQTSNSEKSTNYKNKKGSFSFSNIILWILFFPFKLVWWVLKNLLKDMWKNDHISGNRNWNKFN
jgi:hypothetical protein